MMEFELWVNLVHFSAPVRYRYLKDRLTGETAAQWQAEKQLLRKLEQSAKIPRKEPQNRILFQTIVQKFFDFLFTGLCHKTADFLTALNEHHG